MEKINNIELIINKEYPKNSMVCIILGGIRVGDCLHTIPYFNILKSKFDNITWYCGTYEKPAVDYICSKYNIMPVFIDDGFPTDLNSRNNFNKTVLAKIDVNKYDLIIDDPLASFDIRGRKDIHTPIYNLNTKRIDNEDYIVMHNYSISGGKHFPYFSDLKFPCKVYQIGGMSDPKIDKPNFIDFRNRPLEEVEALLYNSKLYIGIHSAMTCFAFYVPNIKAIICDFMDGGLLNFAQYRENWVELKASDVTPERMQKLIDEAICTNKN